MACDGKNPATAAQDRIVQNGLAERRWQDAATRGSSLPPQSLVFDVLATDTIDVRPTHLAKRRHATPQQGTRIVHRARRATNRAPRRAVLNAYRRMLPGSAISPGAGHFKPFGS
jgi:hypothetical protein